MNGIMWTSTHEKLHIAELWRLPDCGAPYTGAFFFRLYQSAVAAGKFEQGTLVNFSMPAVSRGLITAALEAKRAGLPVNRMIVGSNENRVLVDFLRSGRYVPDAQPQETPVPLLDIGEYPEAEALQGQDLRDTFAAYCEVERRYRNMQALVQRSAGAAISLSTAVAYTALQDHRCVTADGLQAIVLALEP